MRKDAKQALRDDVPHVYILDGVTEIGDHAFGNCAKLYNVHIPESVTKCGLYLFSGSAEVALEEQQAINIFVKQNSWRQVNFGTVNTAEDSIRMGVAYVRTCLELARVTDPSDIDHIQVALQGYNYGTGYISWVWNNYGSTNVEQGQVIGYVGCTGHSTGFHLHFEIKKMELIWYNKT